jgi:hypothetical protein
LGQLDQISSRPSPPTAPAAKEVFQQAKDLIASEQYDDEREVLSQLSNNPKARAWLKRLDEIAPPIEFPDVGGLPKPSATGKTDSVGFADRLNSLFASFRSLPAVVQIVSVKYPIIEDKCLRTCGRQKPQEAS